MGKLVRSTGDVMDTRSQGEGTGSCGCGCAAAPAAAAAGGGVCAFRVRRLHRCFSFHGGPVGGVSVVLESVCELPFTPTHKRKERSEFLWSS